MQRFLQIQQLGDVFKTVQIIITDPMLPDLVSLFALRGILLTNQLETVLKHVPLVLLEISPPVCVKNNAHSLHFQTLLLVGASIHAHSGFTPIILPPLVSLRSIAMRIGSVTRQQEDVCNLQVILF